MPQLDVQVQRLEEFRIDGAVHGAIGELLQICFPGYPGSRTFFKQLPTFRFLVWHEEQLVAHLAVDHRVINNGGDLRSIFGIVDLCVHPDFQHRKLASRLIIEVETLGKVHDIDFLVLLTRDADFYEPHGFRSVFNDCQWVVIQACRSFGIAHRPLGQGFMVKALGAHPWQEGPVDFLGHIF